MMVKEYFIKQRDQIVELEKAETFDVHDYTLAKNVAEKLEEKYPGWLWAVHVMDGVVGVKSMRLSGQWGFVLHADKIDNDYKAVVNAGGEILERYRQHRGKFNQTKYEDLEMDNRGRLNGDLH
jgi:hypothetical protein|tara:strand:- start:467 stop:835 length:369 start_codon:yes stop_codon:yes gene_type:complete